MVLPDDSEKCLASKVGGRSEKGKERKDKGGEIREK